MQIAGVKKWKFLLLQRNCHVVLVACNCRTRFWKSRDTGKNLGKNLYFEKEDRRCQQKVGFDLHIQQVRQMRKFPHSPLLLPWSAAVRFSIKRRKTAAQLGQTNLFISSCYVAISMVRMKLVCLFCAVWKNELVEWLKSLEQNFKATRACSPFPNSRSQFLVLVTSYLKLQYP